MTFGEQVIEYYRNLSLEMELPEGIKIMNPYLQENRRILKITEQFYTKFYNDNRPRTLILAINPGRFGAGVTGIMFTDTIRLNEECGIVFTDFRTYEPSSSFVYEVIKNYGGPKKFFGDFYIHSVCPLGFTKINEKGREVNFNYYDSQVLVKKLTPFIVSNLQKQISFGIERETVICLGAGKNYEFLKNLNNIYHFFNQIVALEHPRFIMQYRSVQKENFIKKYIEILRQNSPGKTSQTENASN